MASETEVSPEQSPEQLSVSVLADVVSSLGPDARVQALPQEILRPLLVSLWQATSRTEPQTPPSPVVELTLSKESFDAVKESPLAPILADLTAGELTVYVADLTEPTPSLFYDQDIAITPYMLSTDEAFFVEMHPPTGDPITHDRSPVSQLPNTTTASRLVDGFDSAIPRGDPSALDSVFEAYVKLPPATSVDLGYLLTLAGSCTGIHLRELGEWAERQDLFSLDAAHRRKRKLDSLDLITIDKEPTGQQGNNVDRIELGTGGVTPDSPLESNLISLSRSLGDTWQ